MASFEQGGGEYDSMEYGLSKTQRNEAFASQAVKTQQTAVERPHVAPFM